MSRFRRHIFDWDTLAAFTESGWRGLQSPAWGGDPVMRHMDQLWLEEDR